MMLTAQMFQEIIRSLRSDNRGLSDRRRYPRVGLRARVNIVPLDMNRRPMPLTRVWVRDLSAGGFGLVVPHALKVGQLFVVQLECSLRKPVPILCEVAQCHSKYRIGARILRAPVLSEPHAIAVVTA